MARATKLVDIECTVQHETDSAYLVSDGEHKVWVPKSQVELDEDTGILTLPEWLAIDKGLV